MCLIVFSAIEAGAIKNSSRSNPGGGSYFLGFLVFVPLLSFVAVVCDIPLHGLCDGFIEIMPCFPPQLGLNPSRINGVPTVVAGTIGHSCDQPRMGCSVRFQMIQVAADALHYLAICSFAIAADAVATA